MYTLSAKLTFYIPHAASLKDKRQKFNVAVAEVETQDIYQTLEDLII